MTMFALFCLTFDTLLWGFLLLFDSTHALHFAQKDSEFMIIVYFRRKKKCIRVQAYLDQKMAAGGDGKSSAGSGSATSSGNPTNNNDLSKVKRDPGHSDGEDDDLDVEAVEDWAVGEEEDLEDCCWKDSCLTKTCEADADRVPPALCC